MGLSVNKTLEFKRGLQQAWETVADKNGNENLSCEEIREVLTIFGCADQIGEEALPLLVKHLDTDNDDRISFDEFMGGMKGWLSSSGSRDDEGTGEEEDSDAIREESIEAEDDDERSQFGELEQVFSKFDKDSDGKLESDELGELLDFLKADKHSDTTTDGEDASQAKQELIKVLSTQLQQMASHSDDGSISYDDFLNALRNLSIALQDFPLNVREPAKTVAVTKPEEPLASENAQDNDELVRLRFDNAALIARQEQLERSLQQIETVNSKLTKEIKERSEELDAVVKKVKALQLHKDKSKELSDQLEAQKEELTRLRKAESELTKANSKLKAELEELAAKHEADLNTQRSTKEELEDSLSIHKEEIDVLRKSLHEKETSLVSLQEQNELLSSELEKMTKSLRDVNDNKGELEIELSQHRLQLSASQSETNSLRDKVKVLEAELQKASGTATVSKPPSIQAELEALHDTQKDKEEEERQIRDALERERADLEEKLAAKERQLNDQLQVMKHEHETARKIIDTQMRREKEEAEEKLKEIEALRTKEKEEWQQQLEEKDTAVRRLTEDLKRIEQDRLDREMKAMLHQREIEVKLQELEQGQGHDTAELIGMRDKVNLVEKSRKKLRLRVKELELELNQARQAQHQAEEELRSRARLRQPEPSLHQEDQVSSFLSSLFMCCLPSSRPIYTDAGLSDAGLSVPEMSVEAQEMRTMRSSKRRAISPISPTQPLIRSDEEDDDEDELEAIRGAGVGLKPSRKRPSPRRAIEDSSESSSGSSASEVATDSSEAEKEP